MYKWTPRPLFSSERRSQIFLLLSITPFRLSFHSASLLGLLQLFWGLFLFCTAFTDDIPKGSAILMLWVVSPITNSYLFPLCLNIYLCLSFLPLLLKPIKTLQHALEGLSTVPLKSISALSFLSVSKALFHLCSLVSLFPSSASHFLKCLYVPSCRLFRQIQKAGHCCPLSVLS